MNDLLLNDQQQLNVVFDYGSLPDVLCWAFAYYSYVDFEISAPILYLMVIETPTRSHFCYC